MRVSRDILEACCARAALAPTVHNTQPARWRQDGDVLSLFCDTDVGLSVGDPSGRDAALSCGAVLEGMALALSAQNIAVTADYTDASCAPGQGLVAVAHLRLSDGAEDGLHAQLERRFTWRGVFADSTPELYGWTRSDTRFVLDQSGRDWIAERNDWASLAIMQDAGFRTELVSWMRLSDRHPRAGLDGMDRAAMGMSKLEAVAARAALLTFWPLLNRFGRTKGLVSEAAITSKTPLIALFHRDIHENPVVSGRAYLRLCLEASSLGFAGWPMAALTDHPEISADLAQRFGIPYDRRAIQAIPLGVPTGAAPPRARRPLPEVLR